MFKNPFLSKTEDPFSNKYVDSSQDAYTKTEEALFPEVDLQEDTHFVNPHDVSGYERGDGTQVDGYWRDGDGDTSVNLSAEDGGGYIQSNPNIDSDFDVS